MLFLVEMDVRLPHDMPSAQADELNATVTTAIFIGLVDPS